jgi:hypothetical protein
VAPRLRRNANIFQYGGVGQDISYLIRASDSLLRNQIRRQAADVIALEDNAAAGRPQYSGEAVEKGALARPIGSDDGAKFATRNFEVHLRQSGKSAETDGQQFGPE